MGDWEKEVEGADRFMDDGDLVHEQRCTLHTRKKLERGYGNCHTVSRGILKREQFITTEQKGKGALNAGTNKRRRQ